MSLQKGFFMTEPFNPDPFWDNTIVNLLGAQKFEEDTVFPAGRYSVDVQAGGGGSAYNNIAFGKPGLISTTVIVEQPFVVRAYCGSRGTGSTAGTNPYSGEFKVNAYMVASNVPAVSHIFGNSGSSSYGQAHSYPTTGNSLGNGAYNSNIGGTGAGTCLHLLPVGGVFGTDYLMAFHVTAAPSGDAGGGSAYGGAGSGAGSQSSIFGGHIRMSSYNAGSTPYGTGGAGVSAPNYDGTIPGNNGIGIGYGNGGIVAGANGAGAWFDGTAWHDSRATADTTTADGHIIVKYVGTIN